VISSIQTYPPSIYKHHEFFSASYSNLAASANNLGKMPLVPDESTRLDAHPMERFFHFGNHLFRTVDL
jgi:hypothetical protein